MKSLSQQKLDRRTIAKSAAWATPILAIGVAAPARAASQGNNARVTDVWYPAGSNVPGYLETSGDHSDYLSDANGQTWALGFIDFVNDGPDPLPAGTVLTLEYFTSAFAPPTIRGEVNTGGISAPVYRTSGSLGYVDVTTLAPIAAGQTFSVNYTYFTQNAPPGLYTFSGSITPPGSFGDSNASDNTMTSKGFGLTQRTDLQAITCWWPGPSSAGYVGQENGHPVFHDNGTTWQPWVTYKNNGPGAIAAGALIAFYYDGTYFLDPTLYPAGVTAPGGVSQPWFQGSGASRAIVVSTNGVIPAGAQFQIQYQTVARNVNNDSPTLNFQTSSFQVMGDTNSGNNGFKGQDFGFVNR